jgi:hypothetical protein
MLCLSGLCHVAAAPGEVRSHQKISDTEGSFTGTLNAYDRTGISVLSVADLDGDGVRDLIVGSGDSQSSYRGALWVLFLDIDGTVKSHRRIGATEGGLSQPPQESDFFGYSVTSLGDLDGNGLVDLAVGAPRSWSTGGRGRVWILFLGFGGCDCCVSRDGPGCNDLECQTAVCNSLDPYCCDVQWDVYCAFLAGDEPACSACCTLGLTIVQSDRTISLGESSTRFGHAVAGLGDLDGDGVSDLAVGAPRDSQLEPGDGTLWILFLDSDGTLKSHQKISQTEGDLAGALERLDYFGSSVARVGDLDDDEAVDIAVGAPGDDDGGPDRGAVWMLNLRTDGTVKSHQKVSDVSGGFTGGLNDGDGFGSSVALLEDLDGDGIGELAVGAPGDDDAGNGRGAVWILFLDENGTVKKQQKISDVQGRFSGALSDHDQFGASVSSLQDLNGDGVGDIAVGAPWDDDGPRDSGAVWLLFLEGTPAQDDEDEDEDPDDDDDGISDDWVNVGDSLPGSSALMPGEEPLEVDPAGAAAGSQRYDVSATRSMARRSANVSGRRASGRDYLTALGQVRSLDSRLKIVRELAENVDVALHPLLISHLERIRFEADAQGRSDLVRQADRLSRELAPPED